MKAKILSVILLLTMVLVSAGFLSAQNTTISLGTVNTCLDSTTVVQVPIIANNLNGAGSISLTFLFDNTKMKYDGFIPSTTITASGTPATVNNPPSQPTKIIVSWYSLTPTANFPNGDNVFIIKFKKIKGSSNFNWDLSPQSQGACEITDADGIPYDITWVNGSLTASLPNADFTSTPSVCSGQDATVTVDFTSGTAPFTIVYNDGVNPNDTVVTSDDPYVFTSAITSTTTWNLVSIATTCTNPSVNKSTTTILGASPIEYNVTGGGSVCPGGSGVAVGLDNSEAGNTYELFLDGVNTGLSLSGTGSALNFGDITAPGTYTITGQNNCSSIGMLGNAVITVGTGLAVSLDPFADVCSSYMFGITLTGGSPAGGIYSGVGVLDGKFYPQASGVGTFDIAYTIVENGCTATATQGITVVAPPLVTLDAILAQCVSNEAVVLSATPSGGTFSGTGVVDNTFDPAVAGPGNWEISYSYTDGVCTVDVSVAVMVYDPTQISFGPLASVCENVTAVALTATPAGGTFSGTGVENGEFLPGLAGIGTFPITYTYTDGNGCITTASQEITVNEMTNLVFNPLGSYCVNATPFYLTDLGPGGTFSGPGVSQEGSFYLFSPDVAGPGTHTITYEVTEANGCYQMLTSQITVLDLPVADFNGNASICAGAETEITLAIAGGLSPYVYTIADPTGLNTYSTGGTVVKVVSPSTTTTYTLTQVIDANGCTINTEQSVTVTVFPLPVITFNPLGTICANADATTLNASPTGGTFSGTGVNGDEFSPASVNPGDYVITYSYTDENGCSSSADQTITVLPIPIVSLTPVNPMCVDALPVVLTGTPSGGTFSGPGVEGNTFNPALAGAGMHSVTYSYMDMNGCSDAATPITIEVFESPVLTFNPLPTVCSSSDVVVLTATPDGGTFSGTGVTGNTFDPAVAGIGTFVIEYSYTNMNGCSNSASQEITVTASPDVIFIPLADRCLDAGPVELIGLPQGGTFSGPGVMDNFFYSELTGAGTFMLTYNYSAGADCSGSASQSIVVLPLPEVTIEPVSPMCAGDAPVTLYGTPAGGTFSGDGVVGNTFTPPATGAGQYNIAYTYMDPNGCDNVANTPITVNYVPEVSLIASSNNACVNQGPITLTGNPSGGVYSGLGVSGDQFDPSVGVGEWQVTYTYSTEFGCTGTHSIYITVNPLPIVQISFASPVCFGSDPVLLNGSPQGGIFSGPGVNGNYFYPSQVNPGNYQINYLYTSEFGCSAEAQQTMTVLETPVIGFAPISPVCADAPVFTLEATPQGGIFTGTAVVGNTFDPAISGSGSFPVTYTYGDQCIVSSSQVVTVNASLLVNAGEDVTIVSGESADLTAIVSGGTAPYSYTWVPAEGLNDPSMATVTASPLATTTYSVMVMDALNCMSVDQVVVNIIEVQNMLSGKVSYGNLISTPLANVQLTLKDVSGVLADQFTITDGNGNYSFNNLAIGDYQILASITHPWGGGNAADGLLMLKHFTSITPLTGIKLMAGDVTGNGYVNSKDALFTLRRFLGTLANFAPVGDWAFESPFVTMTGLSNKVMNVKGLCMGDVNADYNVSGSKTEPTVKVSEIGTLSLLNGKIELPVMVNEAMTVGSFSVILSLPSGITLNNVNVNGENTNLSYSVQGEEVRIGWYSLDPMNLQAGQALFTLSLAVSGKQDFSIAIDGNSVITDENAITIPEAQLLVPKISAASLAMTFGCYPNPVINSTTFTYNLAEGGKTMLELYNALGDRVAVIVDDAQDAGLHSIVFDASSLSQGIYLGRLTVNGITETKTITISR